MKINFNGDYNVDVVAEVGEDLSIKELETLKQEMDDQIKAVLEGFLSSSNVEYNLVGTSDIEELIEMKEYENSKPKDSKKIDYMSELIKLSGKSEKKLSERKKKIRDGLSKWRINGEKKEVK